MVEVQELREVETEFDIQISDIQARETGSVVENVQELREVETS